MASGDMPAIYNISGDVGDGGEGAVASNGPVDPRDPRNMFGFATNYQATQNIMHVHNDTGDAVREEANTLHRVAMDAARAEYSAHLAETVHRLDEENGRRTLELHEQFAESRAFFSAQVSQMRGAISAEVNEAVSQRTAQYSAFAQSLHAETVVAENSEKAVGEQRDSILAENHAMQDTINGLNDTVERLRSDLERAQREMVRRDPQPASSLQNVSSVSFLDKRASIFDDPRLFPTQNAQTSGPMPQMIPQQSWTDPISGAMQFDINENARRSSEQERSRSQQNQPTNQPNVERLIGPETTEAEFRAALLGFVRNQHNRPKAKEADSLRLSEFPTPETYRAWKTATREEIRAASDRPDAAFTWVNKVYVNREDKKHLMLELGDPEQFETLDTKLLAALSVYVKFFSCLNNISERMRRPDCCIPLKIC